MEKQQVEAILEEIVVRNSRLPIESAAEEQVLVEDLGFDSLALMMTLSELESRFEIAFPADGLEEPETLTFGALVEIVLKEIRGDGAPAGEG